MKCQLCSSKESVIELKYLGKSVCASCLERITRRRISKLSRQFELLPKDLREIALFFDFSPTSFWALYYFSKRGFEVSLISKRISSKILKEFRARRERSTEKFKVVIDPKCLDDFSTFFLENLFAGKFKFLEVREKRVARPFICLPEVEIKKLLQVKGIKGFREVKRSKCYDFLLRAEEIRPGSMFSILRLYENIKKLESKRLLE